MPELRGSRRGTRNRERVKATRAIPGMMNGGLYVPEQITSIRERYFHANEFEVSQKDWDHDWRWVSHFWTKRDGPRRPKPGIRHERYRCRLHQKLAEDSSGTGLTSKAIRVLGGCPALLELKETPDGTYTVTITNNHIHDMPTCDQMTIPMAIQEHVVFLLEAGHGATVVERMVLGRDNAPVERPRIESCGGRWLDTQKITNLKKRLGITKKKPRQASKKDSPQDEWAECARYLSEISEKVVDKDQKWKTRLLALAGDGPDSTKKKKKEGSAAVVFAKPSGLDLLRERGSIAVMDATHKTNRYGFFLFTIMVRDDCGSWLPSAFFYTTHQNADIIQVCLSTLIEWCGGPEGWALKYMVTDDSAAEQLAVRNAFANDEGVTTVQHLLCRKHSWSTLCRNIQDNEACLKAMGAALYRRSTEEKCLQSIDEAIAAATPAQAAYIIKNWKPETKHWAHWFRHGVPLLLQVDTTNVVESWHGHLKTKNATKQEMAGSYSLKGSVIAVIDGLEDYHRLADKRRIRSRHYHGPLVQAYPDWGFERLPIRVQTMVFRELYKARKKMDMLADADVEDGYAIVPGWEVAYRRENQA